MRIPQDILRDILDRVDIISYLSGSLELQKSGKDYKGLCPFHNEKSPSFMVSPEKGVYYCFGCSEGGSLYQFLMKYEGLSFIEAVKKLAAEANIDLSSFENYSKDEKERELLFKINDYALWFFKESLKSKGSQKVRDYLQKRNLSQESIETYHLAYAPEGWENLVQFLKSKKIPLEKAALLGLIRQRKDGSYFDFFRDRLIFPIHNSSGRVIAFGGRRLNDDSDEAKYLNSPESSIYHKGQTVYGFFQAKEVIRKEKRLICVEGYMDVIALFQADIKSAIAPLGTALTSDQIKDLKRKADDFILIFDADQAGQRALFKAINEFLRQGVHPRVFALKAGEDPDSYAKSHSIEDIKKALNQAPKAMDHMIYRALEKVTQEPSKKVDVLVALTKQVQSIPSKIEQKAYYNQLAQTFGMKEEDFYSLLRPKSPHKPEKRPKEVKISLERILLGLYVNYTKDLKDLVEEEIFDYFTDKKLQSIGRRLFLDYQKQASFDLQSLVQEDPDLASLFFLDSNQETDPLFLAEDCLKKIKKRSLKSSLQSLSSQIHLAEKEHNEVRLKELLKEKMKTLSDLKELV